MTKRSINLYTITQIISERLVPEGTQRHNLDYALKNARIQPAEIVGAIRLFSGDQLGQIRAALQAAKERRLPELAKSL